MMEILQWLVVGVAVAAAAYVLARRLVRSTQGDCGGCSGCPAGPNAKPSDCASGCPSKRDCDAVLQAGEVTKAREDEETE